MKRDVALERLRRHSDQLKALGVGALYLYGSVARDEADADSDVDLLVDPASKGLGIFWMIGLKEPIGAILGAEADIHHVGGLKIEKFRRRVESDLVRVF